MPDREKGLNRREFITKSVAGMGLVAVLSSPLVSILKLRRDTAAGSTGETTTKTAAATEKRVRAWCMVIDLKKCDGCVTIDTPPQCTQACIQGHFVPKGQQWIQVYEPGLPGGGRYFMPTPCFQCENAPCVNVCPVGATYHTEDGVVLVDHRRCIGCRMCIGACPYHRRFFNWGTPELPPEAALAEYSPIYPVPAVRGTVIKCMFCAHMLKDGKLPLCVAGCPMKALYIGDLSENIASNGNEVVQLSKFLGENNAYRYKEEVGTQPRVWYLPGHGEAFGRHADDPRQMKPAVWSWGREDFKQVGVWPWGKE